MLAQRIPEQIRARLRPRVLPALERARTGRWLLRERMLWGGRRREQLLVQLLRAHYASVFRRQWSRADRMPHFFDHRIDSFGLFAGDNTPFGHYRGRERYDAVVWDGALGHFAPETTHRMLAKIRDVLAPAGVFVGSETLGTEGHDHLQFFTSIDDLGDLLGQHFAHVQVRAERFPIKIDVERKEAFWRCALDPERLERAAWRSYGNTT